MEAWLARLPAAHRSDLCGRLRSRDDYHFEAAFFELYLHTLFRNLGFRVQLHPRAGGKGGRPDFLLRSGSYSPFLVEAATVDELSTKGRAAHNRLVAIYDALNSIDCPDFFLHVKHFGHPGSPIPLRSLKRDVTAFLKTLEYDAVTELASEGDLDALPHMKGRV